MGSRKLCSWDRERISRKEKKLRKLIAHPRYYCASCARASSDKTTLCKPQTLEN